MSPEHEPTGAGTSAPTPKPGRGDALLGPHAPLTEQSRLLCCLPPHSRQPFGAPTSATALSPPHRRYVGTWRRAPRGAEPRSPPSCVPRALAGTVFPELNLGLSGSSAGSKSGDQTGLWPCHGVTGATLSFGLWERKSHEPSLCAGLDKNPQGKQRSLGAARSTAGRGWLGG